MRKIILSIVCTLALGVPARAEVAFDDWFDGRTLRLDYVFAGDHDNTAIYLESLSYDDCWAGRRHNLDAPYLKGNGQVVVTDHATGDTLYVNSFSTLFQEWQTTPESYGVSKAFDATYLVPFPRKTADVTISLSNNRNECLAQLKHTVEPADILIRRLPQSTAPQRYMLKSGTPEECIDIVIVGDGYTVADSTKFFADARRATDALFSHEPFESMAKYFNVLAVATPSAERGPAVPRNSVWPDNAFKSHFDTFYSDRYLTTQAIHDIYDSLGQVPAEHIILLVNTPLYGGGGIFNQLTLASSDHPTFKQVLVHEFGHAYGGLGDEYFYPGEEDETYPVDVEPWEPNITTLVDFASKWADLLPEGTPIPTPLVAVPPLTELDPSKPEDAEILRQVTQTVGVFEGAGYKSTGVYRPAQECRMKVNQGDLFCPVCARAIRNITLWYLDN